MSVYPLTNTTYLLRTLIHPTLAATTRIVFCTNSPLQEAAAVGFEQAEAQNFFSKQVEAYKERRAVLCAGLDAVELPYTFPDGGYFVLVQNDSIQIPDDFIIPDMVRYSPLTTVARYNDSFQHW